MKHTYQETIEKLGSFILETYPEPKKEKFVMPGKNEKRSKTVTVTEPVRKKRTIKTGNKIPGLIVTSTSIVMAFVIFFTINDLLIAAGIGILGSITGVILLFTVTKTIVEPYVEKVEVEKTIEEEVQLPDEYGEKEIPNNFKVKSIGKVVLTFSVNEIQGNKIILCEHPEVPTTEIKLPGIKNLAKLKKVVSELEDKMKNIPYALTGDVEEKEINEDTTYGKKVKLRGLEKDLSIFFNYLRDTYANLKHIKVNLPIVQDDNLTKFLKENSISDNDTYGKEFKDILNSEEGYDFEDYSKNLILFWSDHIRLLSTMRINSLKNEISPEFYDMGQLSQYTSFNFYCPECNKEMQEEILNKDYSVQSDSSDEILYFSSNTRCKYDPIKNKWKCPVCENSFVQPVPVHKSMDEILLPVYDNLMEEHKVEREKHHSEMRKKEIEFKNEMKKEIERILYDNITDLMNLEEDMNKFKAEIDGESDAINYMKRVASDYKSIQSSVIDNIVRENKEVNEEIKQRTNKVISELDEFKNEKVKAYEKEMVVLAKAKRIEDERRHNEIAGTLKNIENVNREGFRNVEGAIKENTEVNREGFKNVEGAVNENTEVNREGFKNVEGAVKENTEVNREGFKNVEGAVKENTEVNREGFKNVEGAVKENTDVTKDGFNRVEGQQKDANKLHTRNNAIQVAMAKKKGINLRDSSWFRLDKKIKYAASDVVSGVTGRDSIEAEYAKEN